ncbi:hypothetical protein [Streptomyces sp. WELS2]|uniref:hypothetical protein n=1 Tax=Streptomyces sp. WELS2 TaxID=2749435 RepID=UPI0015F05911|nr:hypothetical protein [Streptomyces sp. WELS2]
MGSRTGGSGAASRAVHRKGEPESPAGFSKAELYERAGAADVPGRSKMTREQLIEALTRAGAAA